MRKNILSSILFGTQKPSQLVGAIVGCLLGFCLLFISAQLFVDFKTMVSSQEQAIGSQFLVINKQVSVLNSIKLGKTTFSSEEIKNIESQPAVKRISAFTTNQFEAIASMNFPNGESNVPMRTELFMESVGDDFLDVTPEDWNWQPNNNIIPLILPTDFINLYNFNFAPGRGLPQLSKGIIQMAEFDIEIHGAKGNASFKGKIAGFSNRISSVLVPQRFMDYANSHYGNLKYAKEAYRIIVEAKQNELPSIQKFIANEGYETNEELLKNGKIGSLLQAILGVLSLFGVIVMFVSISSFLLYVQLAITRSKYETETILKQGYPHSKIVFWYAKYIGIILFTILSITIGMAFWIKGMVNTYIENFGFEAPQSLNPIVMIGGIILIFAIWIIQFLEVRSQIYKLALPLKNRK